MCTLVTPPTPSTKESKAGGRLRVGIQPKLHIVNPRPLKNKNKIREEEEEKGAREGFGLLFGSIELITLAVPIAFYKSCF